MTRRVAWFVLSAALIACGGLVGLGTLAWSRAVVDTAGAIDFVNPLAIPPLAQSTIDPRGRRVFDLTATAGSHDFGKGPAPTWGFNGAYLGPTLRASRGEQVLINVRNELPEATTVHWHGMHLPAAMDGGPHQPIAPGSTWSPTWHVDQPAATLWYHPHPHGATENHVYRGLAGMFIVDEPEHSALPQSYGIDDIPVIVQDKQLSDDGSLGEGRTILGGIGILGDTIAVNGTVAPYVEVGAERVRLRLLNASNARVYEFGFDDDRDFAMVASDGGLLAAPFVTKRIALSPGERAEIVVDVRAGERAVLRNTQPELGLDPLAGASRAPRTRLTSCRFAPPTVSRPARPCRAAWPRFPGRLRRTSPTPPGSGASGSATRRSTASAWTCAGSMRRFAWTRSRSGG